MISCIKKYKNEKFILKIFNILINILYLKCLIKLYQSL